jgi:hypothetical protein
MSVQPPRAATWLAERFASRARRESLVGDLVEQFRHGRSRSWYWRQVFAAILIGIAQDLATHKLQAVRALAVGATLYYVLSFPATTAGGTLEAAMRPVLACDPTSFGCQFWLNQFSTELLIYIAAAMTGGIVARLHRTYWVSMLSLFAVAVLVFECGAVLWLMEGQPVPIAISPLTLMFANLTVILRPLSVFAGGMWAVRSESHATGSSSTLS